MNLGRYGQMCNQMFEISCTIGTAIKYNTGYIFNDWEYNEYYENPIPTGDNISYRTYNESCFHYKEIELLDNNNWDLVGYYQSEKYFEHCRDTIRHHFTLKKEYKDYILDKYPFLDGENTCSIHIRRGDFIRFKDYHVTQPLEYYNKSISELYGNSKKDIKFVICSDDIEWCKRNLPILKLDFIFIENEINVMDLHILSLCKDNIMSASSFSWWGSWLNDNPHKRVISPTNWFGPKYIDLHDTKDLIPDGWIRL